MDINGIHQGLLGQHRGLFGSTTNTDTQHTRRTPTSTHGRNRLQHPVNDRVRRVEHHHLRLVLGATTLGRDLELDAVTGHYLIVDHRRGVVLGIGPLAGRVGQNGSTQHVLGQVIGASDTFIDHVIQAHGRTIPTDIHPHSGKHGDNTGILTDRPVTGSTHTGVNQNLRHGIAGRLGLLPLIGLMHRLNEINRVIIGNVLQRIGYTLDHIILFDNSHAETDSSG